MPAYLVAVILLVAWKWPWIGGVLFIGLSAAFSLVFGWREIGVLLAMALPLVLIGLLFLADGWATKPELKPRT
jgi:hypothetical protein